MSKYAELIAQAKALMEEADSALKSERKDALAYIRAKMKEFGITPADLGGMGASKTRQSAGKKDRPAKFKGPSGELWSGLGRYPDWLRAELAKGRSKDDYKI